MGKRIARQVPLEWELALGRAAVAQMVDSTAVCVHPESLDGLTERLAAAAAGPYDFRVIVVNDSLVNAFAAPGGFITLHRGLLDLTETPEELAGVLAHEMQHVLLQHGTRAVLREIPVRLIVAAATTDAGLSRHFVASAANLGSLRYSRKAEEEADREGMRLLQSARVDARGMVTIFERLMEDQRDVPRVVRYLTTHPSTETRIGHLAELIAASAYSPTPLMSRQAWDEIRHSCGVSSI